jgi:hypothetical protein
MDWQVEQCSQQGSAPIEIAGNLTRLAKLPAEEDGYQTNRNLMMCIDRCTG